MSGGGVNVWLPEFTAATFCLELIDVYLNIDTIYISRCYFNNLSYGSRLYLHTYLNHLKNN